jgi:phage terminase small subunit
MTTDSDAGHICVDVVITRVHGRPSQAGKRHIAARVVLFGSTTVLSRHRTACQRRGDRTARLDEQSCRRPDHVDEAACRRFRKLVQDFPGAAQTVRPPDGSE